MGHALLFLSESVFCICILTYPDRWLMKKRTSRDMCRTRTLPAIPLNKVCWRTRPEKVEHFKKRSDGGSDAKIGFSERRKKGIWSFDAIKHRETDGTWCVLKLWKLRIIFAFQPDWVSFSLQIANYHIPRIPPKSRKWRLSEVFWQWLHR